MRHAIDAPTGLINVDGGLLAHQLKQARVGWPEYSGDLRHHAGQFSGTDRQTKIRPQFMPNLAVAQAQGDLLVNHEQQDVQPQPMAWQGGGDRILMIGATLRAPAALDHIFRDHGGAHQADILDHAFPLRAGAGEWRATIRAGVAHWNRLDVINPGGTPATAARVAGGATAPFGWRGVVGTRACDEG